MKPERHRPEKGNRISVTQDKQGNPLAVKWESGFTFWEKPGDKPKGPDLPPPK